jgi:DNA polymerase-3 subunit beta
MRFTCDRVKLAQAVSNVSKAVSQKSTIQALEGVLVVAKRDKLYLCAYDLEFSIKTEIDAVVNEPGEVVLPANKFCDMVKKLPSDRVTVEVDEKCLVIITGATTVFTILGIPSLDFPEIPKVNDEDCVTVPSLVLKNMIDRVIFAVSEDEARPTYTGVLFDFKKDKLSVVAVDGFRMGVREENIKNDLVDSIIVPAKTLKEITRLMEEEDSVTKIYFTRKKVCFEIGEYTVFSRLIEGEFFKYRQAVPETFKTSFTIERSVLLNSLERMHLIVIDRLKNPVHCNISEDAITMNLDTTLGKANDTVPCSYEGESIKVGFNCRYMIECLRSIDSDKITVKMLGPLSPIIITPVGDDKALYLVLPVRLK